MGAVVLGTPEPWAPRYTRALAHAVLSQPGRTLSIGQNQEDCV